MTISRETSPASRLGPLRCTYVAIIAALGLGSAAAQAQPGQAEPDAANGAETTDVGIFFGTGRSDNVRRASANAQSGSYKLLGVVLDVVRTRPRLDVSVGGDIEFRDHSISGLDSERVGVVDASLEAFAVPERVSWLVAGRGGQGRTDPFEVESPENREDINIFETGPRFTLPIGERTDIRLAGTAGKRSFENSVALDSDTRDIEAGLYRAVSSTAELGVVVSSRSVEYDVSQFDNDVDRAYLAYSRQLASGNAAFAVGSNRVDRDSGSESNPYVSFDWQREVGARSVLTTTFTSQFVDAADLVDYERLVIYDAAPDTPDGNILLSQDVYESTGFDVALAILGSRTRFTVGAGLSEADYLSDLALDNETLHMNIGAERQMSTRMQAGVAADVQSRDFSNDLQEDEDQRLEIWVQRNFAGPFSGRLGFRRNSRSGTATGEYDENTVTLSFQYDIRGGEAQ